MVAHQEDDTVFGVTCDAIWFIWLYCSVVLVWSETVT